MQTKAQRTGPVLENIRGMKPRKGRLESCPGVRYPSASGKIMRQLPTYFNKKEEETVLASSDPYMFGADEMRVNFKEDPEEEGESCEMLSK